MWGLHLASPSLFSKRCYVFLSTNTGVPIQSVLHKSIDTESIYSHCSGCNGKKGGLLAAEPCWRIDDLAQRAGVTVDTIRYYARERLLPLPERSGRHKLYGKLHLERLARIRELQEQRFSLAAIRAILDSDRPGLAELFGGPSPGLTLDDLIERAGTETALVEALREIGLLPDPAEFGRDAYDESDVAMLRAVNDLERVGMTREVLLELAGIYVHHFRVLQASVHAVLAGETREWEPGALFEMQRELTEHTHELIPAIERVLNYVHQRTVQRLTLDAIAQAAADQVGVGGVPFDDPPTGELPAV
ncbi:MAG: MerR family regulatory protein [Actinomycetia bacterium]|nr:MerR family regulatory protein [Actinomycetes bacterium]